MAEATSPTPTTKLTGEQLKRSLTERQLTMIAIGGAIGVGLFLGSSVTIQLAGPGVIISYLIGALIAGVVAFSLAEMAVLQPFSGSFGVYAETYLSRWAGFCVRVTYGLVQIIAIGAEVTAVGIYFSFWFPQVSAWIWIASVSLGLVAVNALQVANFGEFEYWFAAIKVSAIAAFIVIGLADGRFSSYWHLKAGGFHVKVGERVTRGQVIATSDDTGNSSTPHMHFDARAGWSLSYPPSKLEFPSTPVTFEDKYHACWRPLVGDTLASDNSGG